MIQLKVRNNIGSMPRPASKAANPTHLQTMLNCIDNSGAAIVECVANLRMKRHAKIGM